MRLLIVFLKCPKTWYSTFPIKWDPILLQNSKVFQNGIPFYWNPILPGINSNWKQKKTQNSIGPLFDWKPFDSSILAQKRSQKFQTWESHFTEFPFYLEEIASSQTVRIPFYWDPILSGMYCTLSMTTQTGTLGRCMTSTRS